MTSTEIYFKSTTGKIKAFPSFLHLPLSMKKSDNCIMINDWDTLFPDIHNGSYNTEMCCYKIHPVEKNQQANLSSIQMYRISTLHIYPQLKKKLYCSYTQRLLGYANSQTTKLQMWWAVLIRQTVTRNFKMSSDSICISNEHSSLPTNISWKWNAEAKSLLKFLVLAD